MRSNGRVQGMSNRQDHKVCEIRKDLDLGRSRTWLSAASADMYLYSHQDEVILLNVSCLLLPRAVVSGRLVNVFSANDLTLSVVYR